MIIDLFIYMYVCMCMRWWEEKQKLRGAKQIEIEREDE